MDQSQLPFLMNLLKGGMPPPQAQSPQMTAAPQMSQNQQSGQAMPGVPQPFMPSQMGGSPPPPGGYLGPNSTSPYLSPPPPGGQPFALPQAAPQMQSSPINQPNLLGFGTGGNLNNIQPLGQ